MRVCAGDECSRGGRACCHGGECVCSEVGGSSGHGNGLSACSCCVAFDASRFQGDAEKVTVDENATEDGHTVAKIDSSLGSPVRQVLDDVSHSSRQSPDDPVHTDDSPHPIDRQLESLLMMLANQGSIGADGSVRVRGAAVDGSDGVEDVTMSDGDHVAARTRDGASMERIEEGTSPADGPSNGCVDDDVTDQDVEACLQEREGIEQYIEDATATQGDRGNSQPRDSRPKSCLSRDRLGDCTIYKQCVSFPMW